MSLLYRRCLKVDIPYGGDLNIFSISQRSSQPGHGRFNRYATAGGCINSPHCIGFAFVHMPAAHAKPLCRSSSRFPDPLLEGQHRFVEFRQTVGGLRREMRSQRENVIRVPLNHLRQCLGLLLGSEPSYGSLNWDGHAKNSELVVSREGEFGNVHVLPDSLIVR